MLLEEPRQLGAELAFFLFCHAPQWLRGAPALKSPRRNPNKYRALEGVHQGRTGYQPCADSGDLTQCVAILPSTWPPASGKLARSEN